MDEKIYNEETRKKFPGEGHNTIIHSIRNKLNLRIEEYVFLDTVYQLECQNKKANLDNIFAFTGIDDWFLISIDFEKIKAYYDVTADLQENGLPVTGSTCYTVNDLWKKEFNKS
jgi:hypothetical protein